MRGHWSSLRWINEANDCWHNVSLRQIVGGLLGLVGAVGTVVAAVANSTNQLLIAVLAIIFQGTSAWAFAGVGKVDPLHADRSIAYLVRLGRKANEAVTLVDGAADRDDLDIRQAIVTLRELSVHLSYIQEYAVESVEDWLAFNPERRNNPYAQGE